MSSSTAAYLWTLDLQRKSALGNWSVSQWERSVNRAQRDYMLSCIPPKSDIRSLNKLSAFLKRASVPLTSGIGDYNPGGNEDGDLAAGPLCWYSGYANPDCGETNSSDPSLIPVTVLPRNEFNDRTRDVTDAPSMDYPVALLLDDVQIQVRPTAIRYLQIEYIRFPRDIKVGLDPQYPSQEVPMEGGTGQIDFEWNKIDVDNIIYLALKMAGISLQGDRLVQAAGVLQQGGQGK